ncbi:MAG TPA: GWxTD domain-containing protein [Gemmatimonadaceae bacterium]|nr:GWxTD domain-containing protein [Gemmatimonadaceae bacterium]
MPFAGSVRFLAGKTADSVVALVGLGIATDALTFRREGEGNRADYSVTLVLRRGGALVATLAASEPVRVATIREASRLDESVIFQQAITVAPGEYTLSVSVRDDGSGKTGTTETAVRVPSFSDGGMTAPIPVYDGALRASRDSVARVLVNPRGAAVYGRDSVLMVYVESYSSSSPRPMEVSALVDGTAVWVDTVPMTGTGVAAGVTRVPVRRLTPGVATITASPIGDSDATRTTVFVALADEIPVATHADVVSYLQYFASPQQLDVLAKASPFGREAAWAAFIRDTDTIPSTPVNEGLQTYMTRLRRANQEFREDRPGWRTDRGMVFLLMGEPDGVIDPPMSDVRQRGRSILWQYLGMNLVVEFISTSANQWRLTPASLAQVRALASRRTAGGSGPHY